MTLLSMVTGIALCIAGNLLSAAGVVLQKQFLDRHRCDPSPTPRWRHPQYLVGASLHGVSGPVDVLVVSIAGLSIAAVSILSTTQLGFHLLLARWVLGETVDRDRVVWTTVMMMFVSTALWLAHEGKAPDLSSAPDEATWTRFAGWALASCAAGGVMGWAHNRWHGRRPWLRHVCPTAAALFASNMLLAASLVVRSVANGENLLRVVMCCAVGAVAGTGMAMVLANGLEETSHVMAAASYVAQMLILGVAAGAVVLKELDHFVVWQWWVFLSAVVGILVSIGLMAWREDPLAECDAGREGPRDDDTRRINTAV